MFLIAFKKISKKSLAVSEKMSTFAADFSKRGVNKAGSVAQLDRATAF